MTKQKVNKAKIGLAQIVANGNLEEVWQEKVNQAAKILIKELPEVAEKNPKMIGIIAKDLVRTAMMEIATS